MRVLVVYYSRSGNVKKTAEKAAASRNADLLEIKDTVNRKGPVGYIKSGYHAVKKKSTPIGRIDTDISSYDRVVICGPVWAGTMASPVRTFLQKYKSQIREAEYMLLHASKDNNYDGIFEEMDVILGKTAVMRTSLSR
ncbi:MAG: flavodoxin [Bacillota bacterium]|nr:flavodoxin [Bacillota bacterium]